MHAIQGLKFHVQQQGQGPDALLIHGVTGDLSIWMLSGLMQALSATHKVTAFDIRGHGYTEAPPTGYTSADHAADTLALMDALEISKARIVGHSFGAVIAAHVAAEAPGRVEALVLSDPYFPALRHLEDLSRWGHWQNFRQEAEDAGVMLSGEYWYDLGKFFDQVVHLDPEGLLKLRRAVGLPGLNRLLRLGKTTCGDDSKVDAGLTAERIAALAVPVLAIYGETSPFLSTAEYLSSTLPNCQSAIVKGAQHRAPEENPEAFVAPVLAFLNSLNTPAEVAR
ncbi:alpha/beta hydrolase [Isosphaeraceae bacterium EP7]